MNKRQVISINTNLNSLTYKTQVSRIGGTRPKDHPLMQVEIGRIPAGTRIKVGDLVRCDGWLYTSKPTYIEIESIIRVGKSKKQQRLFTRYMPVEVYKGYWVLRKAV